MKAEKSDTNRNVIAQHLYSLLQEPMIISHIHFLDGFVKSWWGPNFWWQKGIDARTRQAGFRARDLPLRYFIQHRDLKNLMQNWASNPNFAKFVESFPQDSLYTKEVLASRFFAQVLDRHTKHFRQWKEKYAHVLLACEEDIPARSAAAWLLGIPPLLPPSQNYYSNTHRTTIDTHDLFSFLFTDMDASLFRAKGFSKIMSKLSGGFMLEKSYGQVRAMKYGNSKDTCKKTGSPYPPILNL